MYDRATVQHIVRCLRKIAADEEESAHQHKRVSEAPFINDRAQDAELRSAEIHKSVGTALRYLAYALEGD
jgi:hypothetical protein